jgi:hypothetical protein
MKKSEIFNNLDFDLNLLFEKTLDKASGITEFNKQCTLCTGFTSFNYWSDFWKIWFSHLLSNWKVPPRVLVIYKGPKPSFATSLPPWCTLVPSFWSLEVPALTSIAPFNFTFKVQAMFCANAETNIWCDCDNLVLRPLNELFQGTCYVKKRNRSAGGLYSVGIREKTDFLTYLSEELVKQSLLKEGLGSDQKILNTVFLKLANRNSVTSLLKETYKENPYWYSFSGKTAKKKENHFIYKNYLKGLL